MLLDLPAWLHSSALPVALAAAVRELNLKFLKSCIFQNGSQGWDTILYCMGEREEQWALVLHTQVVFCVVF